MSGPSFESWEAQVPSEGFADRATVAVLRDRAHASRRPQRRAWVVLAVAACLLTAGAAWAWAVHPSHMRPDTSASSLDMPPGILDGIKIGVHHNTFEAGAFHAIR